MNKNILVFCPYYPPHVGGLESHADEFNKYLVREKFQVVVFTPRFPKDALERELKYGGKVKVLRFPAWEIIPNYPLPCFWNNQYWKMRKELLKDKYSWVVSRTRFFWTSVMAVVWAKKNRIKLMHVEHGSDFVKLNSWWKSSLAKLFDYTFGRWILKNAEAVVANSKASSEFCKKICSRRKYKVIYRGVDLNQVIKNKGIEKEYKDKVKILFTGRLIDGKGISDLIEAVKRVRVKDWVLFIIGDGPRREDLEKQVRCLGLRNKVKFLGQMDRQKMFEVMRVVDIVVNPSYTEGLPTSVVEAAMCGKAIIATDVGGTREIVTNKKSAFLIPPKKVKLLANKIEILINDVSLRRKMGMESKKEVRGKFSWDVSIKKYIDVLN